MSEDLEAAGAAVTAGLATRVADGPSGQPAAPESHARCRNCGQSLAGAYCSGCGQSAHFHRSLLHFGEEVLHGIVHFDAKAWRTVLLLAARPGLLTRRYIDGQRTRYVSPLGLFLFTMFLMYFVFTFSGSLAVTPRSVSESDRAEARAQLGGAVDEARAAVASAEAALSRAREQRGDVAGAEQELDVARKALRVVEAALAAFDAAVAEKKPAAAAAAPSAPGWSAQIETGNAGFDEAVRQQLKNPDLALYRLKNTAYKFSFLLIPLSLPFLWLMFVLRRDVALYDHAVFCLYSLSFMSLLFSGVALLALTPLDASLALVIVLVPPLHMFLQLRETYGLSTRSALWRTAALLAVAGVAFVLFLVLVAVLSVG